MSKTFVPNNRYKILTDTGFSNFIGIIKSSGKKEILKITIDNSIIKLTVDHKIFIDDEINIKAGSLKIGDFVMTSEGKKKVTKIEKFISEHVYDVLHVDKKNRFYIKSQNSKLLILINNCIYLDELAFVPNSEEFYESVYPVITSSDTTKVIITSTPKGLNYFYKMWVEAEEGRSAYVAYDVKWYEHPDRDQKWYDTIIKNMNAKSVDQEINCVAGETIINIEGKDIEIGALYSKYQTLNSINNNIVYFHKGELNVKS